MLGFAVAGSLIAGAYGIAHDQITYTIGPEYFTQFKFHQFAWANLGLGNRVFVSCIGFLATWWVGLIVAWVLARRMMPNQPRSVAYPKILTGFAIVFVFGLLFGLIGFAYGIYRGPDGDYSAWNGHFHQLGILDKWAFMRVAYIHNFGYLGGLVGLVATYFIIRPGKTTGG